MLTIRPEPLSNAAFSAFGDVLETDGIKPEPINFGNTQKYLQAASLAVDEHGYGQISIYRSKAVELPFRIRLMERHPLGSQAFYPLHQRPFPIVVAHHDAAPDATDIRVFMSNGRQGVNIHRGVWHHYQLSLVEESEYLVIDRAGSGNNYQEHWLEDEVLVSL